MKIFVRYINIIIFVMGVFLYLLISERYLLLSGANIGHAVLVINVAATCVANIQAH